jgi:hypothetical protein
LSFAGSTRSWLKYIGRALQLLTTVHDVPLFPDRKTPLLAGSGDGGAPTPPAPRPPAFGPPLLHQL